MPVNANLDKLLDKEFESKSLTDILAAPISALQGVTDKDADALQQALGIKSVRDLGSTSSFGLPKRWRHWGKRAVSSHPCGELTSPGGVRCCGPRDRVDVSPAVGTESCGTFLYFNRVLAHCCHADHPSQNSRPPTNLG